MSKNLSFLFFLHPIYEEYFLDIASISSQRKLFCYRQNWWKAQWSQYGRVLSKEIFILKIGQLESFCNFTLTFSSLTSLNLNLMWFELHSCLFSRMPDLNTFQLFAIVLIFFSHSWVFYSYWKTFLDKRQVTMCFLNSMTSYCTSVSGNLQEGVQCARHVSGNVL